MLFIVVDGLLVDATGVFKPGQEVKQWGQISALTTPLQLHTFVLDVRKHSGHALQVGFHVHLTSHGMGPLEHQTRHVVVNLLAIVVGVLLVAGVIDSLAVVMIDSLAVADDDLLVLLVGGLFVVAMAAFVSVRGNIILIRQIETRVHAKYIP